VWVLLQGTNKDHKMLPRSKHWSYVGFDDGTKAIKYCNAETRKVLLEIFEQLILQKHLHLLNTSMSHPICHVRGSL
jgi:hypothetical protein